MFSSIKDFLYNYSMSEDDKNSIEPIILKRNRQALKIFSIVGLLCIGFIMAYSIKTLGGISRRFIPYCACGAVVLGVSIYEWFLVDLFPKYQYRAIHMFVGTMYAFAIVMETVFYPDTRAVAFMVILVATSVLFIDLPVKCLGVQVCAIIVFICMATIFEIPSVKILDILGALVFGGVGLSIQAYLLKHETQRILNEYRIEVMYVTDALTGIRNRDAFRDSLPGYIKKAKRSIACIFFDINGFHDINNSKGNIEADKILKFVALGLSKAFGEKNAYRIGGDEFVAFVVDTGYSDVESKVDSLMDIFTKKGYSLSRGMAVESVIKYEKHGQVHTDFDIEKLVKNAEYEMYKAKEKYYESVGTDRSSETIARDIIGSTYDQILQIDATNDRFRIIKTIFKTEDPIVLQKAKFSEMAARYLESDEVFEEDIKELKTKVNLSYIRNYFARGYEILDIRYRRKVKDSFEYIIIELIPAPEYTPKDQQLYLYLRAIERYSVQDNKTEFKNSVKESGTEEFSLAQGRTKKKQNVAEYDVNAALISKVMVIGENERYMQDIIESLTNAFEIIAFTSMDEAINKLRESYTEISTILISVQYDISEYKTFLKQKKSLKYASRIPVIVISENNSPEAEQGCIDSGVIDFVATPYNVDVLTSRINRSINYYESAAMVSAIEYDDLTGIYTKQAFFYHANVMIQNNPERNYDIYILDVKDFKDINEQCGRVGADNLLKAIAKTVKDNWNDRAIYGRYGGDQFVALVDSSEVDYRDAIEISNRAVLEKNKDYNFSMKFGVYHMIDKSLPMDVICDRTMIALKSIKKKYDVLYAVYDESYQAAYDKERYLEANMEVAISEEQFKVFYQPKHDTATGKLIGAEALVRWINPRYGFISPAEFIPLFEKNGFIAKLDTYIWKQVCVRQKEWQVRGLPIVPVSVNCSRVDVMSKEYLSDLKKNFYEFGIDAKYVHIEVTESVAAGDIDRLISFANQVKSMGIQIEMDDFGAGYSSLNILGSLPIDVLKLDMSFMKQFHDEKKRKVLSYVISMARGLKLKTVSEGVETEEQIMALREMGCDSVQGYYYSRPLPVEEFESYLKNFGKSN